MNTTRFDGFPVVIYDLSEYKEILKPFCDFLISKSGESFKLGDDYETGRENIWELESDVVRLMAAVFDTYCLQYLNQEHPKYKGLNYQYELKKDAWLTTPQTKQHVRIHTHLPPFIRPDDVGELITVFYVHIDENIGIDNGPLELFKNPNDPPSHIWAPKPYSLLIMTPEIWHRARPFVGERYSLATDIKLVVS